MGQDTPIFNIGNTMQIWVVPFNHHFGSDDVPSARHVGADGQVLPGALRNCSLLRIEGDAEASPSLSYEKEMQNEQQTALFCCRRWLVSRRSNHNGAVSEVPRKPGRLMGRLLADDSFCFDQLKTLTGGALSCVAPAPPLKSRCFCIV